ncbi:hypothetical protein [Pseudomonas luteola]|uniref:Uncharacterized protein n=2 Tax=Pseudomonas TaxID=286 RepID=A0A2X2C3M7_PSELU|nr:MULTISPECIES: hypothetical protein [Pseudomonas]SHJ41793.1 hypothetical protein SAMN05216295_11352 [Pseudomonas zeshuii]SPZ00116.1 Uncharacterised protein [Pseudomonas luteola]SPZ00323.1 Uncharacterised protein [Pseudomonas luteola]
MLLDQGSCELQSALENNDIALETFQKIDSFLFREVLLTEQFQRFDPTVQHLSIHARSVWVASIRMAFSGQPYAVPPVVRTALESVCYAYLIHDDASLARVWLDRHKDEKSMRNSRNAFNSAVKTVKEKLNTLEDGLGDDIYDAYQQCINDGAHPNTGAIPKTRKLALGPNGFSEMYDETNDFYGLPSRKTRYALASVASIGLLMCYILSLTLKCFNDLPSDQLSPISKGIEDLLTG